MRSYTTAFGLGDRLRIDGDKDIVVTAISIKIKSGLSHEYEVSWFNGGALNTAWIADWRLSPAEGWEEKEG